jgi:hypothetical protein
MRGSLRLGPDTLGVHCSSFAECFGARVSLHPRSRCRSGRTIKGRTINPHTCSTQDYISYNSPIISYPYPPPPLEHVHCSRPQTRTPHNPLIDPDLDAIRPISIGRGRISIAREREDTLLCAIVGPVGYTLAVRVAVGDEASPGVPDDFGQGLVGTVGLEVEAEGVAKYVCELGVSTKSDG